MNKRMAATEFNAEVAVIGGGPGGYTAAFRAADLGLQVMLIEKNPTQGGVCLNVGCIPSKALLHAAKVITDALSMRGHGIRFSKPEIDLAELRSFKDGVVGKLTKGLATLARQRNVVVVQGSVEFTSPYTLEASTIEGKKLVRFKHCIIAAGSTAAKIPGLPYEDPRLIDCTGALALADVPGDRDGAVGTSGSGDLCRALGYRAVVSQSEALVGRDQSVAAVERSAGAVDADSFHGVCLDPIACPAFVGVLSTDRHRALAHGRHDHRGSLRPVAANSIYRTSRARPLQPEVGSFRDAFPGSGSAFAVLSRVALRRSTSNRYVFVFVIARNRENSGRREAACA